MKKILLLILSIITGFYSLQAQNELDALQYSQDGIFGNARFTAMSGAFGALGGEFSALSHNPAGIGMYQFNEFVFSPLLSLNNTKSYSTSNIDSDKRNTNISSLGMVYSIQKRESGWKRINIALGWNQLASYERDIRIEGENYTSSLADKFLELSKGKTIDELDEFYGFPAFVTDIIDLADNSEDTTAEGDYFYLHDDGNYISHINSNSRKLQKKRIISTGSKNEFICSFGGSYNENIYLGVTVGLPTIEYSEKSKYSEDMLEDTVGGLQGFNFEEELSVIGDGVNIKAGAIIRISDNLKIGASLHSPTLYNIERTWSTNASTYFEGGGQSEYGERYYGFNEYQIITPWKATISGSVIINKFILVSADYDIIDYSFAELNSETDDFNYENEQIKNLYTQTNNIRIGTEINIKPFILRGGFSQYGNAYTDREHLQQNYTFGIGSNNGRYFFDVGYILSQAKDEYQLYSPEYISSTPLINTNHHLVLTIGFRY